MEQLTPFTFSEQHTTTSCIFQKHSLHWSITISEAHIIKKSNRNLKCFVLLVIRLDLNFIKKRQMVKTNTAYISCHVSQYAVDEV